MLLLGGIIIDRYRHGQVHHCLRRHLHSCRGGQRRDLGLLGHGGGPVLLGLGSEPLIVAITTALAKWFKGRELSFAFGINLTIARLGSVAADWSPTWAKSAYAVGMAR